MHIEGVLLEASNLGGQPFLFVFSSVCNITYFLKEKKTVVDVVRFVHQIEVPKEN